VSSVTYQSVQQMIRDGAGRQTVETVLTAESTPLTDKQIADLRAELCDRESRNDAISPDSDQIPCADGETYTFRTWCLACGYDANRPDHRDPSTLRTAWRAGEAPDDYTA